MWYELRFIKQVHLDIWMFGGAGESIGLRTLRANLFKGGRGFMCFAVTTRITLPELNNGAAQTSNKTGAAKEVRQIKVQILGKICR